MKRSVLLFAVFVTFFAVVNSRRVKCVDKQPQECLEQNLAFVQKDHKKFCCDSCANVNDVTEPIACIPEKCMDDPQCVDATDCNKDEALVPKSVCYCCNTCVKRNDL